MKTSTPTVQLPPATATAIANATSANTLYPLCYGYLVGLLLKVEAITEVSERFPGQVSPEVAEALRQAVNAFRAVDNAKEDRMAEIINGDLEVIRARRGESLGMHHQNLS